MNHEPSFEQKARKYEHGSNRRIANRTVEGAAPVAQSRGSAARPPSS
ncbi:hypothetical protein [Bradyrhizobium sp. BWC-3-1]|nr:hypothetical protein [Bradyrhizobium sp. BWC-3-1]WOH57635.1 hypothetical protein RX329_36575 [Bradyrhizobium sp. BWC-3-1]